VSTVIDNHIEADSLVRDFGGDRVLHEVSFAVRPGRLTGFVGANGAGKTTTMRILLGVLAATSGEVRWRGEPATREARRQFGYMPEERGLYPKMRVAEQLTYLARLHGIAETDAAHRAGRLLEQLGLSDRADSVLETLSLGNQQRVQIAAALVHDPVALVLDEPFSGLDPLAVDVMTGVLRERAEAGVPVLFSSHQLDVVERLCDDVVILSEGRVVASGSAADLRRRGLPRWRLRLAAPVGPGELGTLPHVTVVDTAVEGRDHVVLVEADEADVQQLLRHLVVRGHVRELVQSTPTLAEIFREAVA
jgi:ABC-2 type transport system ATP-binding protein